MGPSSVQVASTLPHGTHNLARNMFWKTYILQSGSSVWLRGKVFQSGSKWFKHKGFGHCSCSLQHPDPVMCLKAPLVPQGHCPVPTNLASAARIRARWQMLLDLGKPQAHWLVFGFLMHLEHVNVFFFAGLMFQIWTPLNLVTLM
jgi:hypothetical protein